MDSERDETKRFLAAWLDVRQVVQAANFNRFHKAGLSATQFMALNSIPPEGCTLSQLAIRLNLSAASLNETVNSLQKRGFVRRESDEHDRRRVKVFANAEGRDMQNQASEEFHQAMTEVFSKMSVTRRHGLVEGLEEFARLGRLS